MTRSACLGWRGALSTLLAAWALVAFGAVMAAAAEKEGYVGPETAMAFIRAKMNETA